MSFNPDGFDYRFMTEEIKTKGHEKLLDELFKELDCSRYIENVGYPITYNSFAYDRTCWKFNYVLDDGIDKEILSDERCADYRKRFETLDKENELFARNHPEVGIYKKGKSNKKKESSDDAKQPVRRTRKVKTKDMFSGKITTETLSEDGKLKKTAADRRLEALNSRTVNFAFGAFKPKNKDND